MFKAKQISFLYLASHVGWQKELDNPFELDNDDSPTKWTMCVNKKNNNTNISSFPFSHKKVYFLELDFLLLVL